MAQDGAKALELVPKTSPEILLMDLKMPVMNGIQATRHFQRHYPEIKILVLTAYTEDQWVFDAIRRAFPATCSKIPRAKN